MGVGTGSRPRREAWVALVAWVVLAAHAAVATRAGPFAEHPGPLTAAALAAASAWVLLVVRTARGGGVGAPAVVVGALALRWIVLAGPDPGLSDDVHRYVWEGELVRSGRSPFARAPNHPALAELRAALPETAAGLNHPEVPAAYPPVAQAYFAGVLTLADRVTTVPAEREAAFRRALRAAAAGCDLLVLVPLAFLLKRSGRPPGLLVVWGWSPLVVLEFAGSAHFDAPGILGWVGALALSTAGARGAAGLALALSTLVKYLPAASAPSLLRGPGRGRAAGGLALGLALGLAPLALLEGGARGLVSGGLSEYALRWESGSLTYRFVEAAWARVLEPDGAWLDVRGVARATVAAAWLGGLGLAWRRGVGPLRLAELAVALFLVLTPTLHPWYVTWMLPFAALAPRPAWLWLAGAAPLLYWPLARYRAEGAWVEPAWLWPAVALPFFALLVAASRRRP